MDSGGGLVWPLTLLYFVALAPKALLRVVRAAEVLPNAGARKERRRLEQLERRRETQRRIAELERELL